MKNLESPRLGKLIHLDVIKILQDQASLTETMEETSLSQDYGGIDFNALGLCRARTCGNAKANKPSIN